MQVERIPITDFGAVDISEPTSRTLSARQRLVFAVYAGVLGISAIAFAACGGAKGEESTQTPESFRPTPSESPIASSTGISLPAAETPTARPNSEQTPTATSTTKPPDTATATANPEVKQNPVDLMPDRIKKVYADIIKLNQDGVFKDATGGSLSESDLMVGFLRPLEQAAFYKHDNKIQEDFYKYGYYTSVISSLRGQFYATGRDVRIQAVGEAIVFHLKENFLKNFEQDKNTGFFEEFLPK